MYNVTISIRECHTVGQTATEIFLGVGEVSIDNLTFKLHYKWTVTMFIISAVLVTTSQFFGEPISCETVSGGGSDGPS